MKSIDSFCGQKNGYSRSITLRNRLIPVGKTQENLDALKLLESDKKRALSYQEVKNLIDDFHRSFIQDVLSNCDFEWGPLYDQFDLYQKETDKIKKDKHKKELQDLQSVMRKKIVKKFTSDERFSKLFKKEIITELLPEIIKSAPEETISNKEEARKMFEKFSMYFTGFHQNRQNMYSEEEQSTAISYRIVNENFPKFYANTKAFEKLEKDFPQIIKDTEESLKVFLGGKKLKDIFNAEGFNYVLCQTGIDFYNTVIGGIAAEAGTEKIQGLNEKINLARQQLPETEKNKLRFKMTVLYKQILSDKETASFIPVGFEKNEEVYNSIEDFNAVVVEKSVKEIKDLFAMSKDFNLEEIYVPSKEQTAFSLSIFGNWSIIREGLFLLEKDKLSKEPSETQEEKINKAIEKADVSLAEIQRAYERWLKEYPQNKKYSTLVFFDLEELRLDEKTKEKTSINITSMIIDSFAQIDFEKQKNLQQEKDAALPIKAYLDEVQNLYHFLKLVDYRGEEEKDSSFYSKYDEIMTKLAEIIPLYNKVRNFVTKKPGEVKKIRLMFDCSSLLTGWGTDYSTKEAHIFIDNGIYYLGIVNNKLSKEDIQTLYNKGNHMITKVIYDFQKPDNKNTPRLFIRSKGDSFAPAVQKYNLPINEIIDIYDQGKFKTEYRKENPEDYKKSLAKLIDYFKLGFTRHDSYKHYNFTWKESAEYADISEFYNDVINSCYQLKFEQINFDSLMKLSDDSKLFLFQIYNKDYAKGACGKKNLHTLYWENLFSEENLTNVCLQLQGGAELFWRPASLDKDKVTTHKENSILVNRTTTDGNSIKEDIYQEIYQYKNKMCDKISEEAQKLLDGGTVVFKKATHSITKDKHFTQDTYLFHCPITMNFKAPEISNKEFNKKVQDYIKENPDVKIIGLDRGERHLIYLSLINQNGEIELQKTLNLVEQVRNDKTVNINYQEKLVNKEGERDKARKNWQTIGNIKELKEGYLSNVVHEIAKLMVENNAIVVMEDLNFGFKRGRFAVERQVYQKFENMLIEKLNYLVFKDKKVTEPGGVLNAYQLANKSANVSDVGKQCGWIFYIPAAYTSKIDPKTGFANLLNLQGLTNVSKKRDFFSKFDSICYDEKTASFAFTFDYSNFEGKGALEMAKKKWTVYSRENRIVYDSKTRTTNEICITDNLKELFTERNINFESGNNLYDEIMEIGTELKAGEKPSKDIASFWDSLLWNFKIILQMRNSKPNSEIDYLISPVMAEDGSFFDTREQFALGDKAKLPKDADANGAYHIALKGLYLLKNDFNLNEKGYIEGIKNADWFKFVQEKEFLE